MEISPAIRTMLGSVGALSVALDERDAFTQSHCNRVVFLAEVLGKACGLSGDDLHRLGISALFHDIGKIGVPDHVLLKPGRLDAKEWELMKAHATQGERIMRSTGIPDVETIAPIIRHHHESFDGSGYPDGLKGERIPLTCRVMLVVDAYDAMSSSRPYHRARSHKEIMAILESENGTKLDPGVFGQFADLIERSPARVP